MYRKGIENDVYVTSIFERKDLIFTPKLLEWQSIRRWKKIWKSTTFFRSLCWRHTG